MQHEFSWEVYTHNAYSNYYIKTNASPTLPLAGMVVVHTFLVCVTSLHIQKFVRTAIQLILQCLCLSYYPFWQIFCFVLNTAIVLTFSDSNLKINSECLSIYLCPLSLGYSMYRCVPFFFIVHCSVLMQTRPEPINILTSCDVF